jgi:hypothetical protein
MEWWWEDLRMQAHRIDGAIIRSPGACMLQCKPSARISIFGV